MKSYKIKINSNLRAIVGLFVIFMPAMYLTTLIPSEWNDFIQYPLSFIIWGGSIYLIDLTSRGQIKIQLTNEGFRAIWINRFIFSNEKDVELGWDRVIDYVYQVDRGLDSFRFTLTNKQQFKFYRYTHFPKKDEFDKFLNQLPKFLSSIDRTAEKEITQGKTEFQTKSFKRILIVISIIAAGLIINALLNPDSGMRVPTIGLIIVGLLFYWSQARSKS